MSISKEKIFEALRSVRHPESEQNIVELGKVKDVDVAGYKLTLTLEFPSSRYPLQGAVKKACRRALEAVEPLVEVDFVNVYTNEVQPPAAPEVFPGVKHILAVASGKGGVGKSTVAVNLAVALARQGFRTGLLDADVFGPSIPKMLAEEGARPMVVERDGKNYIVPVEKYGVAMLSIGFFVNPAEATIWRGPMASSALKQLMTDGDWGTLDFMVVDLPPGTSDIHLTLVQTVAVTGIIMVSTPQDVALADVEKGISMFRNPSINVPILGLVENMAWFTPAELPENKYYIFGRDGYKKITQAWKIPLLAQIPLVQSIREGGDDGTPAALGKGPEATAFAELATVVVEAVQERLDQADPTQVVKTSIKRKNINRP